MELDQLTLTELLLVELVDVANKNRETLLQIEKHTRKIKRELKAGNGISDKVAVLVDYSKRHF